MFPPTDRCGNITSAKEYLAKYTDQMSEDTYATDDFFQSFHQLFTTHIKPSSIQFGENENADFGHCVFRAKNVYLSFVVGEQSENVIYSSIVYMNCNNVLNSLGVTNNSQNVYTSKIVTNSYNVFFSAYIHNSANIWYSDNLIGCHDCIDCSWLENADYMIDNKQYSKEEYAIKKMEILPNHDKKMRIAEWMNRGSQHVVWQWIFQSNSIQDWYSVTRLDGGKNVCFIEWVNGCTDFVDVFEAGINSHDFYGVCSWWTNTSNIYCSSLIDQWCTNIFYSYHMEACSYCLWCIGLRNKQFCIFNKEYSKEEWYAKVDEIFTQMEKSWTLWTFFPGWMNPFYFNDTAAYLIDESFTKEEVTKDGYMWRDEPIRTDIPVHVEVLEIKDLEKFQTFDPQSGRKIDPEIMTKVIKDAAGNVYKIIKLEYDFLMKYWLPLPEIHWLDRIKLGFKFK